LGKICNINQPNLNCNAKYGIDFRKYFGWRKIWIIIFFSVLKARRAACLGGRLPLHNVICIPIRRVGVQHKNTKQSPAAAKRSFKKIHLKISFPFIFLTSDHRILKIVTSHNKGCIVGVDTRIFKIRRIEAEIKGNFFENKGFFRHPVHFAITML
jgi:hypothetical protein